MHSTCVRAIFAGVAATKRIILETSSERSDVVVWFRSAALTRIGAGPSKVSATIGQRIVDRPLPLAIPGMRARCARVRWPETGSKSVSSRPLPGGVSARCPAKSERLIAESDGLTAARLGGIVANWFATDTTSEPRNAVSLYSMTVLRKGWRHEHRCVGRVYVEPG